ncbi:hypothetical protein ETAA8_15750 [Anatilimnocola aggregata]|uniref:Uncharacterized protein n=1 Tax=Anatilimnocola aggregata TaxID=2528021 RepID=A0A517Y8D8_9BACT|nr:hypothetical protein [Anatilimnocola aggregata]QDU26497.1 hypothetical protein ETAA8_15750 [Anatilimnocola aggregata]
MKWQVHWSTRAESELAAIWLNAAEREAITVASAKIEKQLQINAAEAGESRMEDVRVLCCLPLIVWLVVFPKSRAAMVIHVRVALKRRR